VRRAKVVAGRRRVAKAKTGRRADAVPIIKFGIKIPKDTEEAYKFDHANGNTKWADAIKKELDKLMEMGTLRFPTSKDERVNLEMEIKNNSKFQYARMRMIFEAKSDGTHKARLIIGGHMTKPGEEIDCYSSMMKQESARILLCIADANNYEVAVGDVTNAYLNAMTIEKIWTTSGLEFVRNGFCRDVGTPAKVIKAQYGLKSSGHQWWGMLSDSLKCMGFVRSRGDQDVWMRPDGEDAYEYIGTHVDDLLVVSRDVAKIFKELETQYTFKTTDKPVFHLGVDYNYVKGKNGAKGRYQIGSKTYIQEAVKKVEVLLGHELVLSKHSMLAKWHPELDESRLCDSKEHTLYMQLIGIGLWISSIGRLDITFAISSFSRFSALPRINHLLELKKVFGFLKRQPDKRLLVSSDDPGLLGDPVGEPEGMTGYYPDAKEEIDPKFPEPRGEEIKTSVWFDSDHAHDKKTFRSITGIIAFVGSTPYRWSARRQGAILSSTYGAELWLGDRLWKKRCLFAIF